MEVEMWAVVVVIVGVVVYISVPVALAVIYVSRASATLRHGIPRTSGSAWVGLSSVGVPRSSGGTSTDNISGSAGVQGGDEG